MKRGAALALVLLALAACGKKGDPVPPPGETNIWPRFYPAIPEAAGGATDQGKPAAASDQVKPAAPSASP
jgi:hypothetical protein